MTLPFPQRLVRNATREPFPRAFWMATAVGLFGANGAFGGQRMRDPVARPTGRDVTGPVELRRERGRWTASGPQFYVWQEDESSARAWLEALAFSASRP